MYLLGEKLFDNKRCAAVMTLLFFLSPRMFAEVHYNNKDVIMVCLCFSMFYYGYKLRESITLKNVFMLAFVGALATNLKIIGVFFFGMTGLIVLSYYIFSRKCTINVWKNVILCIVLWLGIFILITPACWNDIWGYFEYLFGNAVSYNLWNDYVLFNGKHIQHELTGIPRKYLPTMILLTTPICILILNVIGYITAIINTIKSKGKLLLAKEGYALMCGGTVLIPLAYGIIMATPVYNGWRHFYFAYAAIIIGAGFGYYYLEKLNKKYAFGAIIAYLAILAVGITINYPQEHSYFNVLAGNDVESRFELDYWNVSTREALEVISGEAQKASVGALNNPTLWGIQETWNASPKKLQSSIIIAENWLDADYIIVNPGYAYLYSDEQYKQVKENYTLVKQIKSYGNVINEIYKK